MVYDWKKGGRLHYSSRKGLVKVNDFDGGLLQVFEHLMKEPKYS